MKEYVPCEPCSGSGDAPYGQECSYCLATGIHGYADSEEHQEQVAQEEWKAERERKAIEKDYREAAAEDHYDFRSDR